MCYCLFWSARFPIQPLLALARLGTIVNLTFSQELHYLIFARRAETAGWQASCHQLIDVLTLPTLAYRSGKQCVNALLVDLKISFIVRCTMAWLRWIKLV